MADQASRHDGHDLELVAAFAAADADPDETARAKALIDACDACATLADDLRAIAAGVQDLGPASSVAVTLRAPRDFRLTAEQGTRLRSHGLVARLGAGLLGGIASHARPVGATLATFGLVGLLVGTVALGPSGSTPAALPLASAAVAPGFGAAANNPAASERLDQAELGPMATDTRETTPVITADDARDPGPLAWLFAGSTLLVVLGAALLLAGFRRGGGTRAPDR